MKKTVLKGRKNVEKRLIDSAAELLSSLGPNQLSIRDIALHAGVNHAQIHHYFGGKQGLLEATYNQPSAGYVQSDYGTDRDSQPQMYLHPFGEGEVLYLSLGHCTGKHDMKPMVEVVPVIRGSWNNPVYYELLRRGIRWGVGDL